MLWSRKPKSESKIYRKAKRRLETVSSEEILRYVDNTHSALGQTVSQIRKSLHGSKTEEALPLIEELSDGSETIRAAASVLLSRNEEVQVK
jgi:hypothetical protein